MNIELYNAIIAQILEYLNSFGLDLCKVTFRNYSEYRIEVLFCGEHQFYIDVAGIDRCSIINRCTSWLNYLLQIVVTKLVPLLRCCEDDNTCCVPDPERLGTSNSRTNPLTDGWFSQANTDFSTNAKLEQSDLTKFKMSGIALDYTFELIPNCLASVAAGYSTSDRAQAQVWYGPTMDEENFYYTAWHGSILAPNHLSSILVCRKRSNGALQWATNCSDYSVTTTPNFLGDSATICRCAPAILDNTLYLCNAVMTDLGPQLYAVNKLNGALLWRVAYDTPVGAPSFVTVRGDYSAYIGSNMAISDLNPVATWVGSRKLIFLGTSSFQNVFNVGVLSTGFVLNTDQGKLFCIEDQGSNPALIWACPTCAPNLVVGDTLVKGGPAAYDPFRPADTTVSLTSISSATNYFYQPYYLPAPPAPGIPGTTAIASVIMFNSSTVINASITQQIWQSFPYVSGFNTFYIYQDGDRITQYDLLTLLNAWIIEQGSLAPGQTAKHVIWSYVDSAVIGTAVSQVSPANDNILYFKYLNDGETLTEAFDAQSLNYYGNSTWGNAPCVDVANNIVYFGTGQSHDAPLDESLYYDDPVRNFYALKVPMLDTVTNYINGTATLADVNGTKSVFTSNLIGLNLNFSDKSPRGNMSYSDAIIGVYIEDFINGLSNTVTGGTMAFGVRSLPWDGYSFLADKLDLIVYPFRGIDGDISSGIQLFENLDNPDTNVKSSFVTTVTKAGLVPIIDITGLNNNVVFDHANLLLKGVTYHRLVYGGPNGALGGSNYACTQSTGSYVYGSHGNMSWFSGATDSSSNLEKHITADGRLFDINNSFISAINVASGLIEWETDYGNRAHAQLTFYNGNVFAEDSNSNLYVMDGANGDILWKDTGVPQGMNGGVVGPSIYNGQILWMNNYSAFGIIGSAGPNGASYKLNESTLVQQCTKLSDILKNQTFTSFDVSPKLDGVVPAIEPVINEYVQHKWYNNVLTATHTVFSPSSIVVFTFNAVTFNPATNQIVLAQPIVQSNGGRTVRYNKITVINKNIYKLEYQEFTSVWGPIVSVWLETGLPLLP